MVGWYDVIENCGDCHYLQPAAIQPLDERGRRTYPSSIRPPCAGERIKQNAVDRLRPQPQHYSHVSALPPLPQCEQTPADAGEPLPLAQSPRDELLWWRRLRRWAYRAPRRGLSATEAVGWWPHRPSDSGC